MEGWLIMPTYRWASQVNAVLKGLKERIMQRRGQLDDRPLTFETSKNREALSVVYIRD